MMTRRQVIAGSTAGMVAGAVPFSQILLAQRGQARGQEDTRLLEHVGREFTRLYKAVKRDGRFRSADLQASAINHRLMALTFPDIRAAAADALAKGGIPPADHAKHQRQIDEVKRFFGVDVSKELAIIGPSMSQPAAARAALAQLAREGLGPTLLKMADALEAQAQLMAVRERDGRDRVELVQASAPYCVLYPQLEQAMEITCVAAYWLGIPGAVSCAVALVWKLTWYYICF